MQSLLDISHIRFRATIFSVLDNTFPSINTVKFYIVSGRYQLNKVSCTCAFV
jgi:hypothetical protein